ncbi:MAG: histidine kinase, partial [Hyphomicrobiales bacterium]
MTENAVVSGLSPDESLRLIEEHGVGTWIWDLDSAQVSWSSGMSRILGVDHATTVQTLESYEQLLHPDDRA